MSTPKAKRIKFSDEEKFLILEEFALRKDILIPKSGRYKNTADCQQAWEEITMAVNSLNPLVQRTPEEIRRKWKNMVVDARKELTMEKHPLLKGQPRNRLFHNIFAVLNTSDGALPKPLLYGSPGRTEPSGGTASLMGKPLSGPPCIFYLCSDSRNPQPCKTETLHDSRASAAAASQLDLPGQTPAGNPPMPQSGEAPEHAIEGARGREEKAPIQPCKGGALNCLRASEEHCTQIHRRASSQIQESAGTGGCRISGPRNCSSDLTLTCKIECPLSPVLQWPYLGAAGSPVTQSSSGSSSISDGLHSAMDDNVSTPTDEDLQPRQRGSSIPPRELPRGFLDKQNQLQTEVLELQKETLQLQKEKILLEKEKLLLEILKLRRELGT